MNRVQKTGLSIVLGALLTTGIAWAVDVQPKYRSGEEVNFEALLIQGQLKRPEISVVTGNTAGATNGLLKVRDHFLDRMSADMGEEDPSFAQAPANSTGGSK